MPVRATVGRTFTMAEVVALTGTAPSTVRYYVATGLLPPPLALATNRHLYDERHVESLRLVRLLKERRHLPVEAIRTILPGLLELPADGAFRPEMWDQLVEHSARSGTTASAAARLVEAGVEAFTRHGYGEVRVDDVCRAAGLAKGSFYRHFSSKEELYFAVSAEVAARIGRRLGDLLAPRAGGELRSEEAVPLIALAVGEHLALLVDLMALAAQRRPGHGRVLREVFATIGAPLESRLPLAGVAGGALIARAVAEEVRKVVDEPLPAAAAEPASSAL